MRILLTLIHIIKLLIVNALLWPFSATATIIIRSGQMVEGFVFVIKEVTTNKENNYGWEKWKEHHATGAGGSLRSHSYSH